MQEKVTVAKDCGAASLVVERRQVVPLRSYLRASPSGGEILVYGISRGANARKLAEEIAFGVERKRRKTRAVVVSSVLLLALVAAGFFVQGWLARREIARNAFEDATLWLERGRTQKSSESVLRPFWRELAKLAGKDYARRYLVEQLSARDWILPIDITPAAALKTDFLKSELCCLSVNLSNNPAIPLPMRQIWIPDGFPVRYALLRDEVAAFDVGGTNALRFVTDFSRKRGIVDEGAGKLVSLRISPDGELGVAEAANPRPALLGFNPFYGDEYWRVPVEGPVTAFAFGNSCERLAFATTNGAVRVMSSLGKAIGQELHFAHPVEALKFEGNDARLHVLVNGNDVTCAIVVQDHENAVRLPSDCGNAASARAFLDLVEPKSDLDPANIALLGAATDVFGDFCRYALKPCAQRPVNVFSDVYYEAWSTAMLKKDILRVVNLRPDDERAAVGTWFSNVEFLARRHAMNRLGCTDNTDPKLLNVHFYDDPEMMWSSDYNFRYILSLHPDCVEAKDMCNRIFLGESGRKELRKPMFFQTPQAENNMRLRKLYLDQRTLAYMKNDLAAKKHDIDFVHEDVARRFAPKESDDAGILWGKMLRNFSCGTDAGALACFEAFLKKNDDTPNLRVAEYGPVVRLYIRERKNLNLKGARLVLGFKAPATEHPQLKVGDIVLKRIDPTVKESVVLRPNATLTGFDRLTFVLSKSPLFGYRELTEDE